MGTLDSEDLNVPTAPGAGMAEPPYDKYAAQNDMRTLIEAGRIRKTPHRMAHARRAAQEKVAERLEIAKIAGGAAAKTKY